MDNLWEHCDEIARSGVLNSLDRHAFEHNAYAAYFNAHLHVLIAQMKAALHGQILTDRAILDQIRMRDQEA